MIGAPVGVDDEVGLQVGPGRLDQNMDVLGRACPALGVADDPAHRVAGGDRAGADELLAGLQRDVGDLAGRGIDLIERAGRERIDLHRVDEAVADRLHPSGRIGLSDALLSDRFGSGGVLPPDMGFNCPGSGSDFGTSTTSTGAGGSARQHCRRHVVIGDLRRKDLVRAAGERGGADQQAGNCGRPDQQRYRGGESRRTGFVERRLHCPSSFDQLMALT